MGERADIYGLRKDGSAFNADISLEPVIRSGAVIVTCVIRDVSSETRANERQTFLLQASERLRSLELEAAVQSVLDLAVPELADWCGFLMNDAHAVERVACTCANRANDAAARELRDLTSQPVSEQHPASRVMRTGVPELHVQMPESHVTDSAPTPPDRYIDIVRALGIRSHILVPLMSRGEAIGALSVSTAESGRVYDQEAFALVQDLAQRAAFVLDNAQLYGRLQQALAEMTKANAAKDDLLSFLTHEIGNATTTIWGNAALISAGNLDDVDRDVAIADVQFEARRLLDLTGNVLVLFQDDDPNKTDTEPILAQHIIEQVVAAHSRVHPARKIYATIERSLPPVRADDGHVRQVLTNLIGNAEKYSPVTMPIEVSARLEGDFIVIRVLDRGPGIAYDERDKIFDGHYRSKGAAQVPGSGIGLAVCKRIVRRYGGSIWARSREDGGAEFGVALPALAFNADKEEPKTQPSQD